MRDISGSHQFYAEHDGTGILFEGQVNFPAGLYDNAKAMADRVVVEVHRLSDTEALTLLASEQSRLSGNEIPFRVNLFAAWTDAIVHIYQKAKHGGDNSHPDSVWLEMNVWESDGHRRAYFTSNSEGDPAECKIGR